MKNHFFINSSVKSLTSFTFHLTFDKQLSKIQKVLSGLPNPKLRIWPNPSLILKFRIWQNPSLILKLGFSWIWIQVQKGWIRPNPNLWLGRSLKIVFPGFFQTFTNSRFYQIFLVKVVKFQVFSMTPGFLATLSIEY